LLTSAATEAHVGLLVTSAGMGNGASLGDLEGADAHCNKLANAAGAGNRDYNKIITRETALSVIKFPAEID